MRLSRATQGSLAIEFHKPFVYDRLSKRGEWLSATSGDADEETREACTAVLRLWHTFVRLRRRITYYTRATGSKEMSVGGPGSFLDDAYVAGVGSAKGKAHTVHQGMRDAGVCPSSSAQLFTSAFQVVAC